MKESAIMLVPEGCDEGEDIISVETRPGLPLSEGVKSSVTVAKFLDCRVRLIHRDVGVVVGPKSNVQEAIECWHRLVQYHGLEEDRTD